MTCWYRISQIILKKRRVGHVADVVVWSDVANSAFYLTRDRVGILGKAVANSAFYLTRDRVGILY